MDYLEHLDTDGFESPVKFRITGPDGIIFPNRAVEKTLDQVLPTDAYDVALTPTEPRSEFAFDAAETDADTVLKEVQLVLGKYNTPPDDLTDWGEIETEDEWRERFTVELADVSYNETITSSASSEEIANWDEENAGVHPIFRVPHRPEKESLDIESDES